jgi:hypothetical protein
MKYIFINYQNEIIHTEETNTPEKTESFLVAIGFEVGGFQRDRDAVESTWELSL